MTVTRDRVQTVNDLADSDLLERAVRGARVHRARIGQTHPRWICVMDTFALGLTYSRQLCTRFGLDPDELIHH